MCLNGHSETYTETRSNGSKVCLKCQKLYYTLSAKRAQNRKGSRDVNQSQR